MKAVEKSVLRRGSLAAVVLVIGGLAAGCETMGPGARNPAEIRRQQDGAALEERLQRISGRIENLQMEMDAHRADLATLRRDMAAQSDVRAAQVRLDELDRRTRESDAARERDREQIIDSLSRQISEILQRGGGSAPAARRPQRAGDSVFEHVVKAGESLSRIAAAYRVTVQAIKDENQLTSDTIRVGQILHIPAP